MSASVFQFGFLPLTLLVVCPSVAIAQWNPGESNTKLDLLAVHNAGFGVAWAAGSAGVVIRSEDDGFVWQECNLPPGGAHLNFGSLWAFSGNHAFVLSTGLGPKSQLFETADGCSSWHVAASNRDPASSWLSLTFRTAQEGVLLSAHEGGGFTLLETSDTGKHWLMASPSVPAAIPQALTINPQSHAVSVLAARGSLHQVYRLTDGQWSTANIALNSTHAAGALSFRDAQHAVAVGLDSAAFSADGGRTWNPAAKAPSGGYNGVQWNPKLQSWIAIGPGGSILSRDDGKTWAPFDHTPWTALSLPWAVGTRGRVGYLNPPAIHPTSAQ